MAKPPLRSFESIFSFKKLLIVLRAKPSLKLYLKKLLIIVKAKPFLRFNFLK